MSVRDWDAPSHLENCRVHRTPPEDPLEGFPRGMTPFPLHLVQAKLQAAKKAKSILPLRREDGCRVAQTVRDSHAPAATGEEIESQGGNSENEN